MMKPVAIAIAIALSLFFAVLGRGAAEGQAPVIVALGDSLTSGLGLPLDQAFPAQLEAALKARGLAARVVNAGVSGDTASAGLARLDWALPPDASAVIIELGANDALQGLPPESTKAALTAIIEKVQARGLPILLAGMEAPRNMGKDYVEAFGAIYPDLAARYGLALYPFFLDGAALNDELMQADGLHPNAKGVAAIVTNILPMVEEMLARVKSEG
jgi:acyl-CoA thioesterase-1